MQVFWVQMCMQDTAVSVAIMRYISVEQMNTVLQLRPKLLRRIALPRKSVTSNNASYLLYLACFSCLWELCTLCIIYDKQSLLMLPCSLILCVLLGTMPFIKKFMTGSISVLTNLAGLQLQSRRKCAKQFSTSCSKTTSFLRTPCSRWMILSLGYNDLDHSVSKSWQVFVAHFSSALLRYMPEVLSWPACWGLLSFSRM